MELVAAAGGATLYSRLGFSEFTCQCDWCGELKELTSGNSEVFYDDQDFQHYVWLEFRTFQDEHKDCGRRMYG